MSVPKALSKDNSAFQEKNDSRRARRSVMFYVLCVCIAFLSVLVLLLLLAAIGFQGHSRLGVSLLTNAHSELDPENAGLWPAILGSLFISLVCAGFALPVGVGTAIFLEEFRPKSKPLRLMHGFIQLNIANLAGVPSIVYGLLGLSVFVYMFNVFGQIQVNGDSGVEVCGVSHYYQVMSLQMGETVLVPRDVDDDTEFIVDGPLIGVDANGNPLEISVWDPKSGVAKPTDAAEQRRTVKLGAGGGRLSKFEWFYFRLPFGRSFLAAGLTLALVILPVVIISSQEALRGVPPSLREASAGLGATVWQTTQYVTIPSALPGILTGVILAMGRAIGEAAPILIVLGAAVSKDSGPKHLLDGVVTMPVLIYNWAGRQQESFQQLSAAAIIVLLAVLLLLNSVAVVMRQRIQSKQK